MRFGTQKGFSECDYKARLPIVIDTCFDISLFIMFILCYIIFCSVSAHDKGSYTLKLFM